MRVIAMNSILKFTLKNSNVKYLASTDEKLAFLLEKIGDADILLEKEGFRRIVKYIVGQQISDKARETIWQRLCNLCKTVSPKDIIRMKDNNLQQIGLSGRKVEYIKNLASSVVDGSIDFEKFKDLSNSEIIEALTAVKGIGKWTAEMYLIFSMGRLNVLSKGDGTLRRSLQWMYELNALPTSKEVSILFEKWTGYETIVSAYFWKSIALGLQKESFDSLFSERGITDE